jgi:peptide subunit release factor RF-3
MNAVEQEIARRRTFAIISHPDPPHPDMPRHLAPQIRGKTLEK